MTKETKILYFKNKYIYNTLISLALFISIFSYCSVSNINLFMWVLTTFYGIDLVFKLNDLQISLRHRAIATYFDKIKYKIIEIALIPVLKIMEFIIYVIVALNMYKIDGIWFALSIFIIMFAMLRIMLTIFFAGHIFMENIQKSFTPFETPEEFKPYVTTNRLTIHRMVGEFDYIDKIIDQDIEIFKMDDPNQIDKGFKVHHKIDVLKYKNKLYNVKKLNEYLIQNNKEFRLLTYNELDLLKI